MALSTQSVVLLADDDVWVRNLVRRILEEVGFTVLPAANTVEALTLSRTYPHRIDVLLADVDISGGSGVALVAQIIAERRDTLVLLMSGGTLQTIPARMPFILKPFSPSDLVAKLRDILATCPNNLVSI
jgi:DNA-binding NtrC family response regulator